MASKSLVKLLSELSNGAVQQSLISWKQTNPLVLRSASTFYGVKINPVTVNFGHKRFYSSDRKNSSSDQCAHSANETHGQPLHQFGSSVSLENAANRYDATEAQSPPSNYEQNVPIDPEVDVYNHVTSVNLSACMQSQVPEPYGKTPTHMNMPGGISRREDKYVQGQISSLSNKREYSTSAARAKNQQDAVDEHGNPTYMTVDEIMGSPCPQGVQGEDCEQFKLWLSNCLKHGTDIECEKLANEYIAGRKTLSQIFAEYELQIQQSTPAGSQKQ